jgi:GT2 family glycosyltransferase
MPEEKKLDVVIVTFNSKTDIERCVLSLLKYETSVLKNIIVIDNNSEDGTRDIVHRLGQKYRNITVIENSDNLGFSRANNQGLRNCQSEFVLFLNPDTEPKEHSISRLIQTLDSSPRNGIVGPQLIFADGTPQRGFGKRPGVLNIMIDFVFGGKMKAIFLKKVSKLNKIKNVDWVSGACLLGRRKLFEEVNGFDEHTFMYSEDVDLCIRVKESGFDVIYDPTVQVVHFGGHSKESNVGTALWSNLESRIYYAEKYFSALEQCLLKVFFVFFLLSRMMIFSVLAVICKHYRDRPGLYFRILTLYLRNQKAQ